MKHTQTLTGTTDNVLLANIVTPRSNDGFGGTLFMKINSGSGTITFQISPDGGTTKYTLKDLSGNDLTGTANFYGSFVCGISNKNNDGLQIYADLSSGTSANVTCILYDVR